MDCEAGVFPFEVEPEVTHRLLNGLDDIGITLQNVAAIDSYESSGRAAAGPMTTGRQRPGEGAGPQEWDAETYDEVSDPQFPWVEVLDRFELRGDEAALDAGCGSGRVTAELVERLPGGSLIVVDGSEAMIAKARERLGRGPPIRSRTSPSWSLSSRLT